MKLALRLLSVLLVLSACLVQSKDAEDARVTKLKALTAKAKDGVVRVTSLQFDGFYSGKSRPYALMVFYMSDKMVKENPNIRLDELRENYGRFAAHYKNKFKGQDLADRVFFLEVELESSGEIFHRSQVISLPWVVLLGQGTGPKSGGMISYSKDDRMKPEDFPSTYPWEPQNFADFLKARAHLDSGKVHVPTLYNNPLFLVFVLLCLLPAAYQAYKIYQAPWFGHPLIWASLVLVVYCFAVSGGLYNIIRGVPLVNYDHKGKLIWYQGHGGQLGAEGFAVGGLYLLFAISSSSLVFFPQWFGNSSFTRIALYVTTSIAAFAVVKMVDFFTWKTGYRLRIYALEGLEQRY